MSDQQTRPAFLPTNNRYKLLYPVSYSIGEEAHVLDELELRRLTLADRLILDEPISYAEKVTQILGKMTGNPRAVLLKIDATDADRIDQIFGYFLQPGPATGPIS